MYRVVCVFLCLGSQQTLFHKGKPRRYFSLLVQFPAASKLTTAVNEGEGGCSRQGHHAAIVASHMLVRGGFKRLMLRAVLWTGGASSQRPSLNTRLVSSSGSNQFLLKASTGSDLLISRSMSWTHFYTVIQWLRWFQFHGFTGITGFF